MIKKFFKWLRRKKQLIIDIVILINDYKRFFLESKAALQSAGLFDRMERLSKRANVLVKRIKESFKYI